MFVQTTATAPEQVLPAALLLLSIVQVLLLLPVVLRAARMIHAAEVLTVLRAVLHPALARTNLAEAVALTAHLVVQVLADHLVAAAAADHSVAAVALHQEVVHPLVAAAEDNFTHNKFLQTYFIKNNRKTLTANLLERK